jgi:hypothetical protein
MRLDEFKKRGANYLRHCILAFFKLFLLAALVSLAYAPFRVPATRLFSGLYSSEIADMLGGAIFVSPFLISLALLIPVCRSIERRFGFRCPYCQKELIGSRPIVIATRCCPFCGESVIESA